jgi:hypothetical protein
MGRSGTIRPRDAGLSAVPGRSSRPHRAARQPVTADDQGVEATVTKFGEHVEPYDLCVKSSAWTRRHNVQAFGITLMLASAGGVTGVEFGTRR